MPYQNLVIPHAACHPAVYEGKLGGVLLGDDWLLLSVLALVVSTLGLTIVYMFASFLRNQQLLTWTKFELFQVFGTAVVLLFFIAVLASMCTFDMGFLSPRYQPTENMYDIIDSYFSKLQDLGYVTFGYIMFITKQFAYMSKVTAHSSPMGVGSSENPLESMGQINSLIFVVLSGFVTSFLLLELQMRVLDYMVYAAMGYLFPMGIFFRCFEPTRSFGGTLLGISIALFLFYPIIMVFNDYLMFDQIQDLQSATYSDLSAASTTITNGTAPDEKNMPGSVQSALGDEDGTWFDAAWGAISYAAVMFIKPVMVYIVAAVFLPVVDFIILVEITRGATAFLGDELDVSNLTRMI